MMVLVFRGCWKLQVYKKGAGPGSPLQQSQPFVIASNRCTQSETMANSSEMHRRRMEFMEKKIAEALGNLGLRVRRRSCGFFPWSNLQILWWWCKYVVSQAFPCWVPLSTSALLPAFSQNVSGHRWTWAKRLKKNVMHIEKLCPVIRARHCFSTHGHIWYIPFWPQADQCRFYIISFQGVCVLRRCLCNFWWSKCYVIFGIAAGQ